MSFGFKCSGKEVFLHTVSVIQNTFEPPHDKTNKMASVPSEGSDQPGHSPSLIRVFASRIKKGSSVNWFHCYHTRCDNRHRILSHWFQLDYWFFELANQTQRYINFEYRKINSRCFSSKSIFYFFLPFENNIIKSISYEIIQNNQ